MSKIDVARLARAVQLGMPADLHDVGVARHGVVAVAPQFRRHVALDLGLLEEGQRPLVPQRLERAFALIGGQRPEVDRGQVDLVDGEGLVGLHINLRSSCRSSGAGAASLPASPRR